MKLLGRTMLKKMVEAVKWAREHSEALAELEKTIQPALIAQWKAEVEAWEEDNSCPNPFESRFSHKCFCPLLSCYSEKQ